MSWKRAPGGACAPGLVDVFAHHLEAPSLGFRPSGIELCRDGELLLGLLVVGAPGVDDRSRDLV